MLALHPDLDVVIGVDTIKTLTPRRRSVRRALCWST
jgi:hypothetical protein